MSRPALSANCCHIGVVAGVQEQFVFVHDAVVVMFTRQLELMQDHCDYYNIVPKQAAVRFLGFYVA